MLDFILSFVFGFIIVWIVVEGFFPEVGRAARDKIVRILQK